MLKIFKKFIVKRKSFLKYHRSKTIKEKFFYLKIIKKYNYFLLKDLDILIFDRFKFFIWKNNSIFDLIKNKFLIYTWKDQSILGKIYNNEEKLSAKIDDYLIYLKRKKKKYNLSFIDSLNERRFKNKISSLKKFFFSKDIFSKNKLYYQLRYTCLEKKIKLLVLNKKKNIINNFSNNPTEWKKFFKKFKKKWRLEKNWSAKNSKLKIRMRKTRRKTNYIKIYFSNIYKKNIYTLSNLLLLKSFRKQRRIKKKLKKKLYFRFKDINKIFQKWTDNWKIHRIKFKFIKFIFGLKILFKLKNYFKKFKKEFEKIKKKTYKLFYIKLLTHYFIFKTSNWETYMRTITTIKIDKDYKKIFRKFKLYLPFFYVNSWHFYEGLGCKIKLFFLLRNLTITLRRITFFTFATMGLIVKKQQHKILKNYQIMLIKAFFSSFQTILDRNLAIIFEKPSKRVNIFFFYLKYYIKKFNKEIYKKKYLRLNNINFYREFSKNNLKGPKKPRRKKFVVKKKKKYQF